MITENKIKKKYNPHTWKHRSPESVGFHPIITPENSECRTLRMYRLNLSHGQTHEFDLDLELNAVVIAGSCHLHLHGQKKELRRFDSFYLPGNEIAGITTADYLVMYVGAAPCEGKGTPFIREYNPSLPLGEIHQIHGKPPYEREVFMTLNPETEASRLIAGLTWSRNGAWTSWPPHQHENDLEEAYCYFDLHGPQFGLHLSYLNAGDPMIPHVVQAGDFVEAPCGYHPTVSTPNSCNAYFWVLAAHSLASRRYDLAVEDPNYI